MKPHYTFGLDIGSTSIKLVVYDIVAQSSVKVFATLLPSRVPTLDAGHFEEDPYAVRIAALGLLTRAGEFAAGNNGEVESIMITGQMHGGLFVDNELEPLSNMITWQDKRCDEHEHGVPLIERLRKKAPHSEWLSTGGPIYTGFLGATVFWYLQHNVAPHSTAKITGIYDWIASSLCGRRACTDPSSASAWGMFDIKSMQWSSPIIGAIGLPNRWLPEVVETGERIGRLSLTVAQQTGLSDGIPVVSGMGDTQASYIGSGCTPNELLLNFGTGSQSLWESNTFSILPGTDTRYLPRNRYLTTVPTLSGGQAYQLIADLFAEVIFDLRGEKIASAMFFDRMNELALQSPAGADGVRITPFFNGSRTKGESLRGSIEGLSRLNLHPKNILRATLEGMIDEVALPYLSLPFDRRPHSGLVGSGNGMRRNAALRMIAEERFDLPLRLSPSEEEAALGAAIMAARSL